MLKRFLFYVLDALTGNYYHIDSNGDAATTSTKTELENSPDGWQDITVGYERDMQKWGVVRTFSLPVFFVERIRKILRTVILTINTEVALIFSIEKRSVPTTPTTYQYLYSPLYSGEIDLNTYQYDDVKDKISIIETGVLKLLKAGEGTSFEIDIDSDPEMVKARMDGLNLFEKGVFIAVDGIEMKKTVYGTAFLFPVSYINSEGSSTGIAFFTQNIENVSGLSYAQLLDSDNCILQAGTNNTAPIDVLVTGTLKFICTDNDPTLGFRARFLTSTLPIANQNDYQVFSLTPAVNGVYSYDVNFDITIQPGEKLFLEGIYFGGATGAVDISTQFSEGSNLTFAFKNRHRTTTTSWLKPSTLFKRLCEKIGLTSSDYDISFLQSYDHLLLGSGDSIRGLANSKIKTTLNEFSDFVRVIMGGGQGIEGGKLQYAGYDHFLDASDPIGLGEIARLRMNPATDLKGNTLKVGYNTEQIDEVNGKSSFNNTYILSSPVKKVIKQLEFVCPYPADPYVIEHLRINLDGKTTTDHTSDNKVFILNTDAIASEVYPAVFEIFLGLNLIKLTGAAPELSLFSAGGKFTVSNSVSNNSTFTIAQSSIINTNDILMSVVETVVNETDPSITVAFGTRSVRRENYSAISGIPDPDTIYNIEDLTKSRIMEKQRTMIDSIFYGHAGGVLKFESTDKNKELSTTLAGVTHDEDADYIIGSTILFKPFYFEFDTMVPTDLIDLLSADPNRCFSFDWKGNMYKGFLVKISQSINDDKSQPWKLLCTGDTDLTPIIDEA